DDLIDAVLLKSEALVSLGEHDDDAREGLTELEGCTIDDPLSLCRAGEPYLTLGDLAGAERVYVAATELDDERAGGLQGLGMAYETRGGTPRMVEAWLRTREIDMDAPLPPWHLEPDEFEKVAEAALAELPEEVRERLANVPILIDDMPTEDQVRTGI